jgi:hypothetical protein
MNAATAFAVFTDMRDTPASGVTAVNSGIECSSLQNLLRYPFCSGGQ